MCKIHELVRGFALMPDIHYRARCEFNDLGWDLQQLQRDCHGEFDVFFLKNGGVAICLPLDIPKEDIIEATEYLADKLGVSPRLIDLSMVT